MEMSTLVLAGWAPPSEQYRRLIRITGVAAVLGFLAFTGVEVTKYLDSLDGPNCERPSATIIVAPATNTHTFCVSDPVTGEERRAVIEPESVTIEVGPDRTPFVRSL